MRRRNAVRVGLLAAVVAVGVFAAGFGGWIGQTMKGSAMAQGKAGFGWEWRAARTVEQRAGLRLQTIRKESGGLFGFLKSPSLTSAIPDPMEITATAIATDGPGPVEPGETIQFRIPRVELGSAAGGDLVAISIIGDAVVCLSPAPQGMSESDIADWLPDAPCDD